MGFGILLVAGMMGSVVVSFPPVAESAAEPPGTACGPRDEGEGALPEIPPPPSAELPELLCLHRFQAIPRLGPKWKEISVHFLYQGIAECSFQSNGSEAGSGPPSPPPRVRLFKRYIYDRQEFVRFDSDRGKYEAVTTLGEPDAEYWNSRKEILESERREVERFCRHNYGVIESFASGRKIQPNLKITPSESSLAQNILLICTVDKFFPSKIKITWLRNGREEDESRVFTTDLIRNGDWTFQMAVMLEAQPERGDVYACQVEHASFPEPITVQWEAHSKSARSKMWTGVVGIVMGVVFASAGISLYLKSKKGQAIPQPAALVS